MPAKKEEAPKITTLTCKCGEEVSGPDRASVEAAMFRHRCKETK